MKIDRRSLILGASTLVALGATSVAESETPEAKNLPTERVQGIGGFFFRSQDPKALAVWYQRNLGIVLTPTEYNQPVWQQTAGPTAFQPFSMNSKYIGPAQHSWMLNFRVANLDAIVAQLRASNIEVEIDPQVYPNGRFARLEDPDGNRLELWQPAVPKS